MPEMPRVGSCAHSWAATAGGFDISCPPRIHISRGIEYLPTPHMRAWLTIVADMIDKVVSQMIALHELGKFRYADAKSAPLSISAQPVRNHGKSAGSTR